MFCKECGKKIDKDSKYCNYCGTKQLINFIAKNGKFNKLIYIPPKRIIKFNLSQKKRKKIQSTLNNAFFSFLEKNSFYVGLTSLLVTFFLPTLLIDLTSRKLIDNLLVILFLPYRFLFVYLIANVAERKNRNSDLWLFLGFILPSIILMLLGMLKKRELEQIT